MCISLMLIPCVSLLCFLSAIVSSMAFYGFIVHVLLLLNNSAPLDKCTKLVYPFTYWRASWERLDLAIITKAAVNICAGFCVNANFQIKSLGFNQSTADSYSETILRFARDYQTVLHSHCYWLRVPVAPCPCQHWVSPMICLLVVLIGGIPLTIPWQQMMMRIFTCANLSYKYIGIHAKVPGFYPFFKSVFSPLIVEFPSFLVYFGNLAFAGMYVVNIFSRSVACVLISQQCLQRTGISNLSIV